jgi:hypothetical protein
MHNGLIYFASALEANHNRIDDICLHRACQ